MVKNMTDSTAMHVHVRLYVAVYSELCLGYIDELPDDVRSHGETTYVIVHSLRSTATVDDAEIKLFWRQSIRRRCVVTSDIGLDRFQ